VIKNAAAADDDDDDVSQFLKNFAKIFRFLVTSNIYTYVWSIKYR